MLKKRGLSDEYYNDLNQIKIGFQSILNNMNHKKSFKMFRFKEKSEVRQDAAAATPEAAAAAATPEAAAAAAEKAKKEAAEAAEKAKKEADEAAKKAEEEAAKEAAEKKAEEMKKQIDENQKKFDEAMTKEAEAQKKYDDEAAKVAEEAAKAKAEAATKDEANSTTITEVVMNAKKIRQFMDDEEFKTYIDKLFTLQTKTLKRQMQEQAAIDLKEMVEDALSDPMISGKAKKEKKTVNSLLKEKKNIV